jgi:hypothetical protein
MKTKYTVTTNEALELSAGTSQHGTFDKAVAKAMGHLRDEMCAVMADEAHDANDCDLTIVLQLRCNDDGNSLTVSAEIEYVAGDVRSGENVLINVSNNTNEAR